MHFVIIGNGVAGTTAAFTCTVPSRADDVKWADAATLNTTRLIRATAQDFCGGQAAAQRMRFSDCAAFVLVRPEGPQSPKDADSALPAQLGL